MKNCQQCGQVFLDSDAGQGKEMDVLSGRPTVWIYFLVCPFCGSEDLDEVEDEE